MATLTKKPLFNPEGDPSVVARRMIGGNTTNLNDFNNLRYPWVSDWYRQAMNNFWIPEEINLNPDVKDYPKLPPAERQAYDKILSFLVFLDSIQTANLPAVGEYVTANEVNLCLTIQSFQECVHSQSYSYMLDTICSPRSGTKSSTSGRPTGTSSSATPSSGSVQRLPADRDESPSQSAGGQLHPGGHLLLQRVHVLLQPGPQRQNARRCRRSATSTGMRIPTCGCSATSSRSCSGKAGDLHPERVEILREMIAEGVRQEIAWASM
jgi:hypothetical protein